MRRSTVFYQDDSVTLYHGDTLDVARTLTDGSVDCIVTSPPYFGLRDYGVMGQIGIESHPVKYVEALRAVFSELRRVLADDGTLWLNLGDSYASDPGNGRGGGSTLDGRKQDAEGVGGRRKSTNGISPKNLLGIPWRVALALQDDGWTLRNDVIWSKPNSMPESVTDRLSGRHEHIFLLSKSRRYWFDLNPIRVPHTEVSRKRAAPHRAAPGKSARLGLGYPGGVSPQTARLDQSLHPNGRNPGDVWEIPTQPFPGAHFATMPPKLAHRCIASGCKPGGVVLDPFSGSGTTGMVAQQLGRRYVGIDLNVEYLNLSLRTRLLNAPLDTEAGA